MAHRNKLKRILWPTLSLTAALAGPAAADEPIVEKLAHGEVNWSEKTVLATGSGAPDLKLPNVAAIRIAAERAAEMQAQRNILETLRGVRVTGDSAAGDKITTQSSGLLKGCKRVDTRYFSDYSVDIVLKCPLDGVLATALAPQSDFKGGEPGGDKSVTGVIIDATALAFKPGLAPRILGDDGAELYSQSMVKPGFLQKHGSVAYASNVEAAKKNDRVGTAPLIIQAQGVAGNELKISAQDAAKLKAAWFLLEGRVIVATNTKAP
ncbi:MAG: hypothetical protein U1E65_25695 [Myxococcota bacterium]